MNHHHREHRTAVFIKAAAASDDAEYVERYNRLLQSFNNTNIKVDIYFYSDNGKKPTAPVPGMINPPFLTCDIHKFCRDMGYVMKMVVTPAFKEDLPSEEEMNELLADLRKNFGS